MTVIDISYWQGFIDQSTFAAWKAAGVERIVFKAGGAEWGLYKDSRHDTNVARARAAGLGVDHYFFNGPIDPIAAADAFIDYAAPQAGDGLWFDIENEGPLAHWMPDQVLAAVQHVHNRTGAIAGVYMSSSVTAQADWSAVVAFGCPLWVAQYGPNDGNAHGVPSIAHWTSWTYWQYTSVGRMPGFNGSLDVSATSGGVIPVVTAAATVGHNASSWSTQQIQGALIHLGYDLGPSGADGDYGPATTAAVHKFEVDHGLGVDVGIAGGQVVGKLAQLTAAPVAPAPAGLALDGVLGPRTITRWQQVMGTPADGTISTPSALIRAVQRVVGVADDGLLGPITRKAVQAHLGVAQDGIWGHDTITALQVRLNQNRF